MKKYQNPEEILKSVRNNLKLIEEFENLTQKKVSEIDTQILLIEPILSLAGYDIYNPFIVKRASRASNVKQFDIEVYQNETIKLVVEIKSFSSNEFNIYDVLNNPMQEKGVYKHTNDKIKIGTIKKYNENGKLIWRHCLADGVGQLKAYLNNYGFANNKPIPILTNGRTWVIFSENFYDFKNQKFNPSLEVLTIKNLEENDFYDAIIPKIKK